MADTVIIGGGAAGAAAFGTWLRHDDGATVHWVNGRSPGGRGVAYATTDEHHLLNVRAASMGLFDDQEEEFVQHASRSNVGVSQTDFLPRKWFGDFIEARVRARVDAARQRGRDFAVHAEEAVRVDRHQHRYHVLLTNGATLEVDQVILAIGALTQRALRTVSSRALASGSYELDPWCLTQRVRAPRRLLVIGTGLTAVDTVLSAAKRWPDAELVVVSRHGQLPLVHPLLPKEPYPQQTQFNAALLACKGSGPMLRLFRQALRESPNTDWRSLIDGMRPVNAKLWHGLTLAQRRQFLRHARWVWEASRHRTAPRSDEAIQQLRDEGRLHIHAARVLGVDGDGPLDVTLRGRFNQCQTVVQADLVVQATGLDTAVAYADHPLLTQLLQDGLAVADPLQLGVAASADGRLINAQGDAQPGLYAIGSLLRGNLWECTAMPEIRAAVQALAKTLIVKSATAQPDALSI